MSVYQAWALLRGSEASEEEIAVAEETLRQWASTSCPLVYGYLLLFRAIKQREKRAHSVVRECFYRTTILQGNTEASKTNNKAKQEALHEFHCEQDKIFGLETTIEQYLGKLS